jgi:tetratricopeptide (TPR) repeat protein/transcriptional regulator with XRE-family HTH domain
MPEEVRLKQHMAVLPGQFSTFGELLKFLRRRAGLTQRELSIAVGYSDTQISRMEQSQRVPDQATLAARFAPPLQIEDEPDWLKRLLELAVLARQNVDVPAPAVPAVETSLLERIAGGQLIGREPELKALTDRWWRARQGHAHLALISGEPGIGKTRLAREVCARTRLDGAEVLSGSCYEFEAGAPYLPFVEGLRDWVGAQREAALREQLGATAPELARLVPEIEARLGPLPSNPSLPPDEARLRLFDNVARFYQSLGSAHGLLIFLDDLHWADQGTLALLHYLLRRLHGARVLVLAAYRELELGRTHPLSAALVAWNRERLTSRVTLDRLSKEETGAMLAALLGEPASSAEFTEAVHRETDGNPFFVEEVVKSLVEQGDVYRVEGGWERKGMAELTIPQSIKEAIGQRLNRLSGECMEVLHTAAALGKVFAFNELAAVASSNEEHVLDALDEACGAQLVRAEGGEAFAFTHDKIREVLYEELNAIRRRRLHQRIAEGLERTYLTPALREAHVADIAHHFNQSGDLERGLSYSLAAAARAQRLLAVEEALHYYDQAREAAEALGLHAELANIHEAIGDIHLQRGMSPLAAEHGQQALTYVAPVDRPRRAVLNMKIGHAYTLVGDNRGPDFLRLAEQAFDPATQTNELAHTLASLGRYHHYQARHRTAVEFYERARHLAEPLDQPDTLTDIYVYLAGAYQHLAQFGESEIWARRSIALGERKNHPLAVAAGYEFLAEGANTQGHWARALEYGASDREIGEKTGALARVAWAEMSRAEALFGRGDLPLALETAQTALALAERLDERRVAMDLGSLLVRIETDLGLEATARADGERWVQRSDRVGVMYWQCLARLALAGTHAQRGAWAEAAALYDQCVALYQPTDDRLIPLILGPHPALARLGLGRVDEAAQMISDYLTLAREAEAPHLAGCAQRAQGQILAAQGRIAEAGAALDQAVATLDNLGSRLELGRTLYQRGLLRRTRGEAEAAQVDLQRALALFEACGAPVDREQVARSLAE